MAKLNCWEFKKCGREPGGQKESQLGVCPAAITSVVNGVHGGKNGGRACWVCAGTFCGGVVQGSFAQKWRNCLECEFFKIVKTEEGAKFKQANNIIAMFGM